MRRPPAHEWAVLGEDGDPVPGDPDAIALLGQTLRDTADAIMREVGEIDALSSVETWQSDAADRFRGAAKDAAANLRKAYHRYDVAAGAMGTSVKEGSTADRRRRDPARHHPRRLARQHLGQDRRRG